MNEYREKVMCYLETEKVVIDEEKGVVENRRILKIKRKKNN